MAPPVSDKRFAARAWQENAFYRSSGGAGGYYVQLIASAGWTSVHWLHRLPQATLILAGRDDPVVPWVNGWIMAHLIRDSTPHIFDGGHLGLLTWANELAPRVRSFLRR